MNRRIFPGVQVIGPGCVQCDEVTQRVKDLVAKNKLAADLEKVTECKKMAALGVFSTPAVVIDGTVKVVSRVPKKDKIIGWLLEK